MLIGGGVIAQHYRLGLEQSETLELVSLVDLNPECVTRKYFDAPFFTDYKEALKTNPDIAILAIPTTAREKITYDLLSRGISVAMEKPMCDSIEKIDALFEYANSKHIPLSCLFHWKKADEVLFLKTHLNEFGNIKSIKTVINDDYAATPDGSIRHDRRGLLGAWYDSGINVLSYYGELFDLSSTKIVDNISLRDGSSNQFSYTRRKFNINGICAEIIVDWTTPSRNKYSEIICDQGILFVNHTAQKIQLNGKIIFTSPTVDRLSSHYDNLFRQFTFGDDYEHIRLLHKILFTGNAQ